MEEGNRPSENLRALVGADRSQVADPLAVEVRRHLGLEVAAILDDARDDEREADATGDLDRLGRALLGMDPPEEQEVPPVPLSKREVVGVDPVMNGGHVVEAGM